MRKRLQSGVLIIGLVLSTMRAVASPDIDSMSDMEVTEYATRFSVLLQEIEQQQICHSSDISCISSELYRNGISYEDKESLQKRLVIMVGSMY